MEFEEVRAFLTKEARLADEHRYSEWLELWDDEALYWVPCNGDDPDPDTTISVIYDDRVGLENRMNRLATGDAPAQQPPSRMRRLLSGIEVEPGKSEDATIAHANFSLFEWRRGKMTQWIGRTTYELLGAADGGIRIRMKKIVLLNNDDPLPPLAFII